MKLFQKTALATAIAAVPFLSVNAMEALDDSALSEMTGQAGVTIETTVGETGITIGSIEYTDTNEGATNEIGGGSLVINGDIDNNGIGIKMTGAEWDAEANSGDGGYVDAENISKQTIDIDDNGNLITATENVSENYQRLQVGNVSLRSSTQQSNNKASVTSAGASLVSDLDMITEAGDSKAHILNLTSGQFDTAKGYNIANMEAVSITTAGVVDLTAATDATSDGGAANLAIVTEGESRIENLDVKALDGAIEVEGLKYGTYDDSGAKGNLDGMVKSTQVIWAKSGDASSGGGVYIAGSASVGTLEIGSVKIGQGNIGKVRINDISQAGSTTRIYGH